MSYRAGVFNVRETPTAGAGTTAQRKVEVLGALWVNTDNPAAPVLQRYDGTTWVNIGSIDPTLPAWSLSGNAVTVGTHKLGTTTNHTFVMVANNAAVLNFYANGNVATGADDGYKLSITGTTRFRGILRVDNAGNGNLVELQPGGVGVDPRLRLLSAGSVDLFLGRTGTTMAVASDAALSTAALYTFRARGLEIIGGNGVNASGAADILFSAVANNAAGNSAALRLANLGVEKWVIGVLQGDTFLHFRSGNGTMSTATEVAAMTQGGRMILGGNAGALSASSALQVDSTTACFCPPRMTTVQRDAIVAKAGDMVYNTTTNKHQGYDGATWNDFY